MTRQKAHEYATSYQIHLQIKMKLTEESEIPAHLTQTRAHSLAELHFLFEILGHRSHRFIDIGNACKVPADRGLIKHTWERYWDFSHRLKPDTEYSAEDIYGDPVWRYLRTEVRRQIEECVNFLAFNGIIPVDFAGRYDVPVYLAGFPQIPEPEGT